MNTQTESIHGHDVLHWVESHPPMSRPALTQALQAHFGQGAVFHTCSMEGLSLETLLEFLYMREKIRDDGQGTRLDGEHICNH